jgi:dTDP-4-dehydrorhamnose reductase
MARIIVFGSSGNIGASLVRVLRKNGHDVTSASRNNQSSEMNHLKIDLEHDFDQIANLDEYNYAFLAFQLNSDIEFNTTGMVERNLEVTFQLIEALRKKNIKIGFFSSASIFDGSIPRTHHSSKFSPRNYYGAKKVEIEKFLLQNDISCDIFRTGKILGKMPVIDKWVDQSIRDEAISIHSKAYISPLTSDYLAEAISETFLSSSDIVHQLTGNGDINYLSIYYDFMRMRKANGFETTSKIEVIESAVQYESLQPSGMFSHIQPPSSASTLHNYLLAYTSAVP